MMKNFLWLIAISLSFVLATVSYAQTPKAKPAPHKSAIWGQETSYGTIKKDGQKTRLKERSFGASRPSAVGTPRKRRPQPRANKADSKPTQFLSKSGK